MGVYEANTNGDGGRACPFGVCDGSGYTIDENDFSHECACLEPRLRKARAKSVTSPIPRRYRGLSLDRPPLSDMNPEFVTPVKSWVDSMQHNLAEGNGFWLLGNTGTGKTSLAMWAAQEALSRDYTVAIYSTPALLAMIRGSFDGNSEATSYAGVFRRLTEVDLLVLDDLGSEKTSDWVVEQLFALINERYIEERAIAVTANLITVKKPHKRDDGSWEDVRYEETGPDAIARLEDELGFRTMSRIVEMCGEPTQMFGMDQRLEHRPASFHP